MRLGRVQVIDKRYLDFSWNMNIASVAVYLVESEDDVIDRKTPVKVLQQHERTVNGFDMGISLEERLIKLVPIAKDCENGDESFIRIPPTPISIEYKIEVVSQMTGREGRCILSKLFKKTTYGCNLIIRASNQVEAGLLFYQYGNFRYPLPRISGNEKKFAIPGVSGDGQGRLSVVCLEEDQDRFTIKRLA